MMENFRENEQRIRERSQEIKRLMIMLCEHLGEDENLLISFGLNRIKKAAEIQEKIFALIQTNDFDKELLIKETELIRKYNLNVRHFPNLKVFDPEKAEELAREKLALLISKEGADFEEREEIENLVGRIEKAKEEINEFYDDFWIRYYGIIGHIIVEY